MTTSEVSLAEVNQRLQDRELLRNYCTFACFHRARLAHILYEALDDDQDRRRTIGIEIVENYVAMLEDIAMWFFVLRQWARGSKSLFELLEAVEVRESQGWKYSTEAALTEISGWTIADMRREFGMPLDDDLKKFGLSESGLRGHIAAIRDALSLFQESLSLRRSDQGILVVAYNKLKHGLVALSAVENSSIGASVIVASTKGTPKGLKVGWIPCEDDALAKVVDTTVWAAEALCAVLNILYVARFDNKWVVPAWSFKSVYSK